MKRLLLILAFFLVPSVTNAAIGFGAISAVDNASSRTSVAVSGSNPVGIVWVAGDSSDNITAVSWGGVAMTKIGAVLVPGDRFISAWCINNPASSATISFTGGSFWRNFNGYYTGATCPPVDSFNTGTVSANTTISVSTTVVAANSWVIMFQKDNAGGKTYSAELSVSSLRANADAGGIAIADSNAATSTGTNTGRMFATGSANHGAIIFSIAPAPEVTARCLYCFWAF